MAGGSARRVREGRVGMRRFHRLGVITDEREPGEIHVAAMTVPVTNPAGHPDRVVSLRFEPGSPVAGPARDLPHMTFAVDDLEAEIAGEHVLRGHSGRSRARASPPSSGTAPA